MSEKIKDGETEHREARRPLELTEELFRQVLNRSRDAIYLADMQTRALRYQSPGAEGLTGFTLEELWQMGATGIQERIHPDDQERYLEGIRALLEGRRSEAVEYRWLHKDGHYRWFSDSHTIIPGADAQPQFLAGTVRDITKQKQRQQRREERHTITEQRLTELEAAFDSVTEGLSIYDPQGHIQMANPVCLRLLGFGSLQEAQQHQSQLPDIFQLRDAQGHLVPAEEWPPNRAARGEQFSNWELLLKRQDTGREWVGSFAGGPVRDAQGHIILAVVTFQDITARHQAEEDRARLLEGLQTFTQKLEAKNEKLQETRQALETERQRYQELFQFAPDGYIVTDKRGVIREANAAAATLLGMPPGQLIGDRLEKYVVQDQPDDFYLLLERLKKRERVNDWQVRLRPGEKADEEGPLPASITAIAIVGARRRIIGLRWLIREIRRRVTAETALRQSEERFRSVLDNSRDGIYRLNLLTGEYDFLSPSAQILTGFSPQEIREMGREGTFERLHPDDRELYARYLREPSEPPGQPPEPIEYRWRVKSGEWRWFSDNCKADLDAEGRVVALVGATRDITARKEAEAERERLLVEVERQRALLEAVINSLAEGIIITDAAGHILAVNPAGLALYGYDNVEQARQHLRAEPYPYEAWDLQENRILNEERPLLRAGRGEAFADWHLRVRRKDTGREWIGDYSGAPVLDAQGQVIASVLAVQDITGQEKARKELEESEARLREVLDNSQDAIYRHNLLTRRFEYFSAAIHSISGYTPEELMGLPPKRILEYIHPEDRKDYQARTEVLAHSDDPRAIDQLSFRWKLKSGGYRWMSVYRALVRDDRGRPIACVGSIRDINDQMEAQQEREALLGQLEELTDTLEQRVAERTVQLRALAAELSQVEERERRRLAQVLHDHLQQLLVAARLSVNIMQRQLEQESLRQAAERVDEMLREAIQTSRSLTAELSPPVLYDVGLAAALNWLARWMQERHGLLVEVDAQDLDGQTPEGLRAILFQAARELLFNVVKHAQVERAAVRLQLRDDGIELTVSDQGVGMDPALVEKRHDGGFGLFNVRERLEMLGGRMTIASGPGQGTRVILWAPLRPEPGVETATVEEAAKRLARPTEAEQRAKERAEARPVRVLLVDDHIIVRQGLARLLQDEPDVELVGEAGDGREAVALAHLARPDVILMDVTMPIMDGIEATRRVLEDLPDAKVIGLSMHGEQEVAARMRQVGAVDYVLKGGDPLTLLRAVRRWAPQNTMQTEPVK